MYLFVFGSLFLTAAGRSVWRILFTGLLRASIFFGKCMTQHTGASAGFCVWDAVRSGGRACGDQKDCETMCRKMRKKGKNGKIVQKSKERK